MSDLIDRQAAIRLVHSVLYEMMVDAAATDIEKPMSKEDKLLLRVNKVVCTKLKTMPSAEPESLTDKEQRIFLAAMSREEEACKQVDDECRDFIESYDDSLVRTCHEITRKVKGALWT